MPLLDQPTLLRILDVARFAPSVHNTQPWKVSFADNVITVSLDEQYLLTDGDPTTRQTIISLGIFIEALLIGATKCGFSATNLDYQDRRVNITLQKLASAPSGVQNQIALLKKRATDRSIFSPANITKNFEKALKDCPTSKEVKIHLVTDRSVIDTIALLTSKGIRLALSSPGFRKEISQFLLAPWSSKKRGIATSSLYLPFPVGTFQPWLVKLASNKKLEASLEKKRWQSASGVVVVTAEGDMPTFWFAVGRTYLRASLAIEEAGLSQATSAAIVEAANFHEDIEQILNTNQRILAVIRVGKGSRKRHYSPRVSAEELATSS